MDKKIKKLMKEERGSITVFVVTTMLFLIMALTILFMSISNKNTAQRRDIKSIASGYESEDIDNIYQKTYEEMNSESDEYRITYALEGGLISNPPTKYNSTADDITLPCPTKTGYTFAGWTGSNGSEPQTTVKIAKGSTGNKNYRANWTVNNYTITYNLGSGTLSGQPTSYNIESEDFTLPIPTSDLCAFVGWTGSNGTTPQISVTIPKGSIGDVSYTANWVEAIAKIDTTLYPSLQEAVNAVPENKQQTTITLLKDTTENTNISENKNIVLELDNHTVSNKTNEPTVLLDGKMKMNNGTITGTYTTAESLVRVEQNAELSLSNTTLTRTGDEDKNGSTIEVNGKLKMESGMIINEKHFGIMNKKGATVDITGGEIVTYTNTLLNYGTATINQTAQLRVSSTLNNYPAVINYDKAIINIEGGAIDGNETIGIWNRAGGTANITGGTIKSTDSNAVKNEGTLDISDGTLQSINDGGVYNDVTGIVDISGGEINAYKNAMINYGELRIDGDSQIKTTAPTENGRNWPTINNEQGGFLEMSGGTIDSAEAGGIWNKSKGTDERPGAVIKGGMLKSTAMATIANEFGGVLEVLDGTLQSESSNAIYNKVDSTVKIKGGTIKSTDSNAVRNEGTLDISDGTLQSINGGGVYNTATGIVDISGGEINVIKNVLNNYGTATIEKQAKIMNISTKSYPGVVNQDKATVNVIGGTIDINSSIGLWNMAGGTAHITGGTIKSTKKYAVQNDGTLDISDGTLQSINSGGINNTATGIVDISGGEITAYTNVLSNCGNIKLGGTAKLRATSTGAGEGNATYPALFNKENGILTIEGGDIKSVTQVISNKNQATVTITGGTLEAGTSNAINNEATCNIFGGSIISKEKLGIWNNNVVTIGNKSVQINTTSPSIQGKTYGVYSTGSGAIVNFDNGILKSGTNRTCICYMYNGSTLNIRSGYSKYDYQEGSIWCSILK